MNAMQQVEHRLKGNQVDRPPNFNIMMAIAAHEIGQPLSQGTPNQEYQASLDCLKKGGLNMFSGAGCEIPDHTPPENLFAQVRALENYYKEDK